MLSSPAMDVQQSVWAMNTLVHMLRKVSLMCKSPALAELCTTV